MRRRSRGCDSHLLDLDPARSRRRWRPTCRRSGWTKSYRKGKNAGPGAPRASTWRSSAASSSRRRRQRLGQEHAAAPARHARRARRGRRSSSTAERIDDRPDRRRDELRNRTFGFIFQFYHLLPELTALENVLMPQMIRHGVWSYLVGAGAAPRARRPSCSSGSAWAIGSTTSPRSCPAARCSGRPSPGRWSAGREILLADEPTGNLDAATGQGVLELLRDLNRERGLTIIMVTHDTQIAQQADRVVRLAEGRIEEWAPALA